MAERSSLNQVIQIGVESTPGTAVATTKRFQSIGIEPSPTVELDQFRPSGQKFRSLATLNKEWVTAQVAGKPTYTEIIYMLSSLIDTGTITTPGGATNARNWNFAPDSFDDDTPITYTVEHGSSFRADRFAHGLMTEMSMSFSRSSVELSGSMMGQELEDGVTLTGSQTSLDLIPVLPSEVSVYLDDTAAELGDTKLTRVISAEASLSSRFNPVWVLDAAEDSFVAVVEAEPDLSCTLVMEADSVGMAQLTTMRTGVSKFLRIHAVSGTEIDAATNNYELMIDVAVKVSDTSGFSDSDGIYAIEWSFVGVHDATWGQALDVNVQNAATAL